MARSACGGGDVGGRCSTSARAWAMRASAAARAARAVATAAVAGALGGDGRLVLFLLLVEQLLLHRVAPDELGDPVQLLLAEFPGGGVPGDVGLGLIDLRRRPIWRSAWTVRTLASACFSLRLGLGEGRPGLVALLNSSGMSISASSLPS